jgi:hypothetical protein
MNFQDLIAVNREICLNYYLVTISGNFVKMFNIVSSRQPSFAVLSEIIISVFVLF